MITNLKYILICKYILFPKMILELQLVCDTQASRLNCTVEHPQVLERETPALRLPGLSNLAAVGPSRHRFTFSEQGQKWD